LDATAEGSFMSLTPRRAEVIMAKMEENQNWTFNTQTCYKSEEVRDDLCALSTKMDVLLSWLEQRDNYKRNRQAIQDAFNSQDQHEEDINAITKKQGWSQPQATSQGKYQSNLNQRQPPLRELILEQARINESIYKKLAFNDEMLEGINSKLDNFSLAVKEQILFIKKIESEITHLASILSTTNHEQIKGISTRGGKVTRDPPYPKGERRPSHSVQVDKEARENNREKEVEEPSPPVDVHEPEIMKDFHDTTLLPFPQRRSTTTDERFSKFVNVILKLYVNIPLLDAMQVPTYAQYLRAILKNKGPVPSTEVIKLIEACSEAILCSSPIKKNDLGCPTIDCSIGN